MSTEPSELRKLLKNWCKEHGIQALYCIEESECDPLEDLLSLIETQIIDAEKKLRKSIASQAPPCKHSLASEAEHKLYCGFINSIWVNWAVKQAELKTLRGKTDES